MFRKMRTAFVVLVSIRISLTSGFSVPSGAEEVTTQYAESNMTTDRSEHAILPVSRQNIDESALYEHATDKENNLNERAFVFINQKYKKKTFNPYNKVRKPKIIQSMNEVGVPEISLPCNFNNVPSYAHLQGFDYNHSKNNTVNCDKQIKPKVPEQEKPLNVLDRQREHLELLKPPILRPNNVKSSKEYNYQVASTNERQGKEMYKTYQLNNQNHIQNVPAETNQVNNGRNYGFFKDLPQNIIKAKENVPQIANFEDDFLNNMNEDSQTFFENMDADSTLDQYLKEDPLKSKNYKINNNEDEMCSYQDCILKTTKASSSNIVGNPNCICPQQLNFKASFSISRNRIERQENGQTGLLTVDNTNLRRHAG